MNFSDISEKEIEGLIEEARLQLEGVEELEGGQQTDLWDYISIAEAELDRRRSFSNGAVVETLKAL